MHAIPDSRLTGVQHLYRSSICASANPRLSDWTLLYGQDWGVVLPRIISAEGPGGIYPGFWGNIGQANLLLTYWRYGK